MDEELREIIEIARVEAEFALLEIQFHSTKNSEQIKTHLKALIVRLDDFLSKTHWANNTPRSLRN